MNYHPVFLDLRDRSVVVIGGGPLALSKVNELLRVGARVTVVGQSPGPELEELARTELIRVVRRRYRFGDLAGAWLAIAAGGDPGVHRAVKAEADRSRIWLNAIDDVPNCSFIAGSVHRQGDIVVAVSTSGACPALAVRLRQLFARLTGPELGGLARMAATLRQRVARLIPDFERRRRFWYTLVDSEAASLIKQGKAREARRLAGRLLAAAAGDPAPPSGGRIVLVGAGPGDPGLVTWAGLSWIRAADVLVHDRLVSPALLAEARSEARLIDVGKTPNEKSITQERINRILIEEAAAGRLVVRLKGGDPMVFGRGSEEADAARQAEIPCEIVPGVSSAIAAPAAAGIPVTRRGVSSAFVVVTGREARSTPAPAWGAVSAIPTIVVLMGVESLPEIADRLIESGRRPDTPAAVISRATLPGQREVRATLETIADVAERNGIAAPATLVVGEVVTAGREGNEKIGALAGVAVEGRHSSLRSTRSDPCAATPP